MEQDKTRHKSENVRKNPIEPTRLARITNNAPNFCSIQDNIGDFGRCHLKLWKKSSLVQVRPTLSAPGLKSKSVDLLVQISEALRERLISRPVELVQISISQSDYDSELMI